MQAIGIAQPGGPEALQAITLPVPQAGPGEVLIRVAAAGVNRADIVQRQGFYPPPPGAPDTPGLEVAGEVVAVGVGVESPRVGERVCALLAGGGYAEFAVAAAAECLPVPDSLDWIAAAALPEALLTVWSNVVMRAGLAAGDTFLVHGGSSGIGTVAIQLARLLGARVACTVGTADKAEACRALGAEIVINYREQDFVAVLGEAMPEGVDVILDMVGGDYVQRNISVAAREGRIINIAFLQGARVELDLLPLMLKRVSLAGSTLRAREPEFKAELTAQVLQYAWPWVAAGELAAPVFQHFPLAAAADAHRVMESSQHIGKLVLVTDFGAAAVS